MFEYDAPASVRMEIIETAISTIFDALESEHDLRPKFVAKLEGKLKDTGYDQALRHGLQHAIAHLKRRYGID